VWVEFEAGNIARFNSPASRGAFSFLIQIKDDGRALWQGPAVSRDLGASQRPLGCLHAYQTSLTTRPAPAGLSSV
jgi:hypothetical protein